MKLKALTVGLALAFPLLASAQDSSVTLYGNIDTAINWTNNIGQNESDYTGVNTQTNSWPSYWGLRGSEKLSDNLTAVFNLESGFNSGTGGSNQGGRLFGRQAWVGLKGDWGQLSFGRQYSMLFWSMLNSDIMGPNAHGLGGLDGYIPDRRQDNSILYMGNFNGIKFGATYAKGRDTNDTAPTGSSACGANYDSENACSSYSAMLGYDAANWGVNVAYDVLKGSEGKNWRGSGLDSSDKSDRRLAINAWTQLDALKLGLVYINRNTDGTIGTSKNGTTNYDLGDRSDLYSLGASYALTPAVTIDGSVNYINFKNARNTTNSSDESSSSWLYVARVKYALSKRTSVYASAGYVTNNGAAISAANSGSGGTNLDYAPAAGNNQTSVMAGVRHSF